EIKYLPPYSPQLNPVERVFQDIKKHFKNKVFDSLDKLEDKLFKVLNSLSNEYLKSLTFYPYIREAFSMI
ncbi:transposase, partial [Persephonella sp.]